MPTLPAGFDALMHADLVYLLEVDRTGRSRGYYSRLSIAASIAHHYAIIGDRDSALTWLEQSAPRRDDGPLMITMWYWQPFRDEPRFQAIERLVGMPDLSAAERQEEKGKGQNHAR